MQKMGITQNDRKVLTFVDARQDAALQAGHFNDFIRIGKVRSAIWNAIKDATEAIDNTKIARMVLDNLHLQVDDYSKREGLRGGRANDVKNIMERYLSTIIYDDLAGNWTVIMPNLEDCALSAFDGSNSSRISTSNFSAMMDRVSKLGCAVLVHHLETVAGSLPISPANHFAVFFCSTKTSLRWLRSLFAIAYFLNLIQR